MKIFVSLMTLGVAMYILFFVQQTIEQVEKHEVKLDEEGQLKLLLRSRSTKTFNLEKFLELGQGFTLLRDKIFQNPQNVTDIAQLPRVFKQFTGYLVIDSDNWSAFETMIVQLLDADQDDRILVEDVEVLAKICLSHQEDQSRVVEIFFEDEKSGKKHDSISQKQLLKKLKIFQKDIKAKISYTKKDDYRTSKTDKTEITGALYDFFQKVVLQAPQQPDENAHEGSELDRRWAREYFYNKTRWDSVSQFLFTLFDYEDDGLISHEDISNINYKLLFDNYTQKWLINQFESVDLDHDLEHPEGHQQAETDTNQEKIKIENQLYKLKVTKTEFEHVSQRIRHIFRKYYDLPEDPAEKSTGGFIP